MRLSPETMKLLGSTKSNLTKNKNGENVSHLEITEVPFQYLRQQLSARFKSFIYICS